MEDSLNASYTTMDIAINDQEILLENYSSRINNNYTKKHEQDNFQINHEILSTMDHLFLVLLIVIMLSIGTEITWTQMKNHLKHPTGLGIAMVTQFFIKPLAAYALMRSSNVTQHDGMAILIISSCPGGVLSNAFTYFCSGDLSLSVMITTMSTLLAMGLMPLNLWIYGHSFETKKLILPYGSLWLYLVYSAALLIMGMLLRWKFPTLAVLLNKVGNCIGLIIVTTCIVLEVLACPDMFVKVTGNVYGVVLTLPLLGLSLGFLLAYSFKQNVPLKKTITIDCGLQNIPCIFAIISESFSEEDQRHVILLLWIYAFVLIGGYTVLSIAYQIYNRIMMQKTKKLNGFDLAYTGQMVL